MAGTGTISPKAFAQGSTFPPTTPGVLRIYSMRFCPYAQRTRLVLAHKNIPHEVVNINLKSKPDWYLNLNPLGQVPVLQLDDQVIPESTATSDWLDDVYPDNRLQPSDPYRRAWDRVLCEYASKVNGAVVKIGRSDQASAQQAVEELQGILKFVEEKLASRQDGPFFGGSQPAMIDFLLWPMYERLPAIIKLKEASPIDPETVPKLTSWLKAMSDLPAVKATGFDLDSYVTYYKGYLTNNPNFDLFLPE